ncbi:MAG TPA: DUF4214 domain-containing protein [Gemmataceae bacterium]|nr:DUF4214 domain-containing protein [Gemmataceae bacterium]
MNPLRRLFRVRSPKSSSTRRPPPRWRAQLGLEALETRLIPVIGIIRPPIGGIVLPEFVVPVSQPTDSTHFHSIAAALAPGVPLGARLAIIIEPGASPDSSPVSMTTGNVTIEGDLNVPAAILPSEQVQVAGSGYFLTNLNLNSLVLGNVSSPGDSGTSGNVVSKCLIQDLQELGIRNTFTQNTITGEATFDGVAPAQNLNASNNDVVANNTFASAANPILTVSSCDSILIDQNTFYGDTVAIRVFNSGHAGFPSTFENNTITMSSHSSTGIDIKQLGGGIALVNVFNNTITTAGVGLSLLCQVGANFSAVVEGNDFSNTVVAVKITGDGATTGPSCGTIDLGGGSNAGLHSSLGGNDFRGLASGGFAITIDKATTSTVTAHDNLFPSGPSPSQFVFAPVGNGSVDLGSNPLSQTQAFVQGLYNDLLGRTGSLAELNAWVNVFNTQGQAAVANDILRSSESLGRVVDSFYLRFLGRQSDTAGRAAWVNILQHGASLESVEAGFITSPEYLSNIDTDFVQSLYINLLGRTGSAAELAPWNNGIQALGLAGIGNAFLTSQEYRADNVTADFATFLHRPPSPTEISQYAGSATDLLGIEAAILSTPECFSNI